MAISYLATGAADTSGTGISPALPAGWSDGDLAVVVVASGHPDEEVPTCNTTGWTYRGALSGGGGTFGDGAGPRMLTFYSKELTYGDESPSITISSASGSEITGACIGFTKASSESWNLSGASFQEDTSSGTSVSATVASDIGVTSGDYLVGAASLASTGGSASFFSSWGLSATGATIGTVTERVDSWSNYNSEALAGACTAAVSSGTATGNVTVSCTAASAATGVVGALRLRVATSGTVTTTTDSTHLRIGVTLDGWGSDDTTQIYREVVSTGVRTEVRGGDVTPSGGQAFVWDYEAPTGVTVQYVADDGGNERTSSTTSISSSRSWLRSPGLPGLDLEVYFGSVPEMTYERPTTLLSPIGRRTTIPVADSQKAPSYSLTVVTQTTAEAADLRSLLESTPTAFVLFPNTVLHATYVSLGNTVGRQVAGVVNAPTMLWTIEATEVSRPSGGMSTDPTASWQALIDNSATWADVATDYSTWLDVLRGVPGL